MKKNQRAIYPLIDNPHFLKSVFQIKETHYENNGKEKLKNYHQDKDYGILLIPTSTSCIKN